NGCTSTDTVCITNNTPQLDSQYWEISDDSIKVKSGVADINYVVTKSGNSAVLTGAQIKDGYGVGHWELGVGGGNIADPNQFKTTVTDLDLGRSTFKWIVVNNGCRAVATVTVDNGSTTDADAGENVYNLCSDSYTLSANGPFNGIGQWTVVYGSGAFVNAREPGTKVTGLQKGRNTLMWTITYNGRITSDTVQIWNMSVTDAYAGVDRIGLQSICSDSIAIQGNDVKEGDYTYTNASTGDVMTITTLHEWSLLSGSGEFRMATNSDPVLLDGSGNVTLDSKKANSSFVYKNVDELTDAEKITYEANTAKYAKYSRNPLVVGLKQGTNSFLYRISNDYCYSVDTVHIFNDRADDAWACGLGNKCDTIFTCDGTVNLNPNSPTYGTGEWKVASGGSAKFNGNYAYDLAPGTNTLIWEISTSRGGDCTTRDYVTVQNNTPTTADAGYDEPLTVCGSESVLSGNKPQYYTEAYWELVEGAGQFVQKDGDGKDVKTLLFTNDSKVELDEENGYYVHIASDGSINFIYHPEDGTYYAPDGTTQLTVDYNVVRNYTYYDYNGNVVKSSYTTIVIHTGNYKEGAEITYEQERNMDNERTAKTTGVLVDKVVLKRGDGTDNQTLTVNGLAFGKNRFRWVVINGTGEHACSSEDETVLDNIFIQSVAGDVPPICTDSVKLNANNPSPGVGLWSIAAGRGRGSFVDSSDPHTYVTDLGQGNNYLIWTVNYLECPSVDTVVVLNNQPTEAKIYKGNQHLCDNNETILTAQAIQTELDENTNTQEFGYWEVAEGAGKIVSPNSSTTKITDIPFSTKGNRYQWVVKRVYDKTFTCVSYDSQTIYYDKVEADAGDDDLVCSDEYVLRAKSAEPAVGEWQIVGASSAGSFDDTKNPTAKITKLALGKNVLRWTTTYNSCSDYDEITIYNGNPSVPSAGNDQPTICVVEGPGVDMTTLEASAPEIGIGHWVTVAGQVQWDTDTTAYIDNDWLRKMADEEDWTDEQKTLVDFDDPNTKSWYKSDANHIAMANDSSMYNPKAHVHIGKGVNTLRWIVEKRNVVPMTIKSYDGQRDSTAVQTITCVLSDDVKLHNLNPSEPEAGTSQPLCQDHYQLKATKPLYGQGRWTIDTEGGGTIADPNSHETEITNLTYGVTTLKWTVSTDGMCPKSDYIVLKNMSPTKADAGPSGPICEAEYPMNANTPIVGTGHWEVMSGNISVIADDGSIDQSFEDIHDPQTLVSNFNFGRNVFVWQIENSDEFDNGEGMKTYTCVSADTVVLDYRVPDQAIAGKNQTVCLDHTLLNANTPQTGRGYWRVLQGEGVFTDSTDAKTEVTNLSYGENIFRWTIEYLECTTDSDVHVYSLKADPYAGEDDVTYSDTYQLNAGNPGRLNGYWTVLGNADKTDYGGSKIEFADSTSYNTFVYGLSRGVNTFRWVIQTDQCTVYDEVSITYKVVPKASFTVDYEEGCFPLTVRFSDASQEATKYNWDFGDGTTSTIRSPTHTYQLPGNYEVHLTVPGPDGISSDTVGYITVYDHPIASFDAAPQLTYIPEDKVHFINRSTGATEFLWNLGDGTTTTEKNPLYTYKNEGFYTVTLKVWNEHGCEADTVKESFIEARRGGFIMFPNTYAPRVDVSGINSIYGVNANFRPVYQDVETFNMQIFNRWGQLVFETSDINVGWDGHFNGTMAPEGMYTWVAKGRFLSGKEYTKSGYVLLLK
ncbi:MAG: PKD domain-containing protein, partial [Bacteroidales bacterium]|nr:PKD domain-containing protein [Bacteroidales bacterium]